MRLRTLHLVDGESTGGTLKASGIAKGKDILPWKDALYSGPVRAGLSLQQLSRLRSRFWTNGKKSDEFRQRNAQLSSWRGFGEVVLWFGATSICQLSLAQILTWFSKHDLQGRRLSLVTAYGGTLRPEQLLAPYQARTRITGDQTRLATRLWNAFTSASPMRMQRLLQTDLRPLPEFRDVIYELLQEYPGRYDGLSRLERKLLLAIASMGSATAAFAIVSVIQRICVGDTLLFDMLRRFVSAPAPLLTFAEPFTGKLDSWMFNGAKLRLTPMGKRVLEGKEDHVALNGIDRWIGGVHLLGRKIVWRWDERKNRIVRISGRA